MTAGPARFLTAGAASSECDGKASSREGGASSCGRWRSRKRDRVCRRPGRRTHVDDLRCGSVQGAATCGQRRQGSKQLRHGSGSQTPAGMTSSSTPRPLACISAIRCRLTQSNWMRALLSLTSSPNPIRRRYVRQRASAAAMLKAAQRCTRGKPSMQPASSAWHIGRRGDRRLRFPDHHLRMPPSHSAEARRRALSDLTTASRFG